MTPLASDDPEHVRWRSACLVRSDARRRRAASASRRPRRARRARRRIASTPASPTTRIAIAATDADVAATLRHASDRSSHAGDQPRGARLLRRALRFRGARRRHPVAIDARRGECRRPPSPRGISSSKLTCPSIFTEAQHSSVEADALAEGDRRRRGGHAVHRLAGPGRIWRQQDLGLLETDARLIVDALS